LEFAELRGNIDTRLSKIPEGGAIVMAVAALQILDMTDRITEMLSIDEFVPAIGQGCVAIECRSGDSATIEALGAIDHASTRHDVEVERAFLAELGSGCSLPVGGHVANGVLYTFLANLSTGMSISGQVVLSGDAGDIETARNAAHSAHDALN
jgi:hydroxymethylbilane synthase